MPIRCLMLLLVAAHAGSQSLEFKKLVTRSSTEEPSPKSMITTSNPLIGDDGKIYACSGKYLFAFENNGRVAWVIPLNYVCNVDITPVIDEKGKIYLVAEDRILKIMPSKVGTSESTVEIFFGQNSTIGGSGEIIGLSISTLYPSIFISIKKRGLFAFLLHGQLLWSAGPMIYRFGYRQGCKKNIADCYFGSVPVVDQCEGTIYIANTEGQLYSLYIRSPNFRWIQDFSPLDKLMTVTPGNNGRLYIMFPRKALVMALDASSGNVCWQNNVGPLSTEQSLPVVDTNGWVSISSLDGFLYTFSPSGDLKKFLEKAAPYAVIRVSPVLDCSGFAVYISQTLMEAKSIRTIANYTYVSATKPISMVFTLLAPATGTVYWSEKYPGKLSSFPSKSDLHHFVLDERIMLAVFSSARIGNPLPCYTTRQKIAWTCSQAKPKFVSIYTGNERAILLFLFFQFLILVLLAGCVRFCCIFWRKEKLKDNGLGRFIEKRRSLHNKRKTFSKMISELELKATGEATTNESLEQLGEIVKAKEGVERKLSTCYSLGRDRAGSQWGSILPLYGGKTKSHSFQSGMKESVTIFNTLSDTSSGERSGNSSESGHCSDGGSWHSCGDVELAVKVKAEVEAGPSKGIMSEGQYREPRIFTNTKFIENQIERSRSLHGGEEELVMQPLQDGEGRKRMWLKRRRTLSSTN